METKISGSVARKCALAAFAFAAATETFAAKENSASYENNCQ